jgi:hypothetical protein
MVRVDKRLDISENKMERAASSGIRGMAQVASGARNVEGAVQGIAMAATDVAWVLGVEGPIIAAIGALAVVGTSMFMKWREESKKFAKEFEQDLKQMKDAGDNAALAKKARDLWFGTGGEDFKDGLVALKEQRALLAGDLRKLMDQGGLAPSATGAKTGGMSNTGGKSAAVLRIEADIADIDRKMKERDAALRKVREAMVNPRIAPWEQSPLLTVTTTAIAPTPPSELLDARAAMIGAKLDATSIAGGGAGGSAGAGVQELIDRMRQLRESGQASSQAYRELRQQLAQTFDYLSDKIADSGGPQKANADLLKQQADAAAELSAKVLDLIAVMPGGFANITGNVGELKKEVKSTTDAVTEMADALGILGAFGGQFSAIASGVASIGAGARTMDRYNDAKDAAKAAGKSGPGALATISAGLGIAGAVVGAFSAVKSLFGKSDEQKRLEQERNQLMKTNNDRLDALRAVLMGYTGGLDQQAAARQAILAGEAARQRALKSGDGGPLDFLKLFKQDEVMKYLTSQASSFGLTPEIMKKLIADSGIQLFDSKGKLIAGALDQLIAYFDTAAQAASRFGASLDDQRALLELHDKVFGKTSDTDALTRSLGLLDQFAPALGDLFDGMDATTAEGRAKIQKALQDLVTMIEAGGLTPEQLGGLTGVKQLAEIILGVQSSLDALGKAADATTSSLLNVPEGYKVAAARFDAIDALQPGTTSTSGGGTTTTSTGGGIPASAAQPTDTTPSIPTGVGLGGETFTLNGDVYIDATGMDPEDLFDAVVHEGRRRAHNRFGDASRWSEVQR